MAAFAMTRREKFLSGIDLKQMRGIEIGPLMSPMVTKADSDVFYVDHADRETLQAKYAADPNVDTEKIVSVDAIWGDRTLRECFPDGSRFDYVIASHVIEHVPDMLGWMREIADVLGPSGRLILAIPDRRYTFDYLRQPTRLNEVVDAYLRRNRRPMPAQIFDYNANAVELDMIAAWENRIDIASLKHFVNRRFALDRSIESVRDGKYIDGHCWVFTARSLAVLLLDLFDLDLLPYRCAQLYEPERNTNEILLILEHWQDDSTISKEEVRQSYLVHVHRLDDDREAEPVKQKWAATERELETAKQRLQAAEQALETRTREIALLQDRIHVVELDLASLLSSRSFRITEPLRKLRAFARSLAH
jgi:SAM-dependent methyltransferase